MKFSLKFESKISIAKLFSWLNQDKLFSVFTLLILFAFTIIIVPTQLLRSLETEKFFLIKISELGTAYVTIVLFAMIGGVFCKLFMYLLFGAHEAFKELKIIILILFVIFLDGSITFIQAKEQLAQSNFQESISHISEIFKLTGIGVIVGIIVMFTFLSVFRIVFLIFRPLHESQIQNDSLSRVERVLKDKKLTLGKLNMQKKSLELFPIVLTSLSRLLTITSIIALVLFAYIEFTNDVQKISILLSMFVLIMFCYSVIFTEQLESVIILQNSGYVQVFQQTQGIHLQGNQYFLLPKWYKSSWQDINIVEIVLKILIMIPLLSKIPYYYTVLNSLPIELLSGVPIYFGCFLTSIIRFYLVKQKKIEDEVERFILKAEERINRELMGL